VSGTARSTKAFFPRLEVDILNLRRDKKNVERIILPCVALLLAACAAGRQPVPSSQTPQTVTSDPAAQVQARLTWYLSALAGKEAIDDAALRQHFAPEFLSKIPPAKFREFTESLRAAVQRLEVVRLEPTDASERVHAVTRAPSGAVFHVLLAVEPSPPHRITLLLVKPDEAPVKTPPVQSWQDAERQLRALAPRVSLLAADLESGGCAPIHEIAAGESLAVGSAYKLFVLGALAREVEAGSRSWNDVLPGRDMRPLSSAAETMIATSDNMSADDLVIALGRESIERFAQSSGISDPRLAPILLTNETFGLKYATSEEEKATFVHGSRDDRLALAKRASSRKWNPPLSPSSVATIGWFSSLRGLCGATAALREMATRTKTELIGQILAKNPGIGDAAPAFSYVGYKGGSEPGIFNVNFLLKRASDGKWLYLGTTLNDERHFIDEKKAIGAIAAIRSFLARAGAPSS
jgi:beta-lactamase class A